MNKKDFQKSFLPKLPDSPGVYLFKHGKNLLYVGKATSLKQRVRSYFSDDLIKTRGRLLVDMVTISDKIEFIKTDSVLEALLLEAQYIKENQPKYNTKDKDNKSYNYVVITEEDFPRILVIRGRSLEQDKETKYKEVFGPFPYGGELKEALRLIRKIFPFRDKCTPYDENKIVPKDGLISNKSKPCFNRTIGLCPGVCSGEISKKDYAMEIKNIKLFFEGRKPALIKSLEKQMLSLAKEKEFEKAGKIKRTIFALNHIQDVSLIKNPNLTDVMIGGSTTDEKGLVKNIRIEAYDIAHMSGKEMVGVMVVMENGGFANNQYRKFIINNFDKANDAGALEEVINRRIKHSDWQTPNIVVLDGNEVQLKRGYKSWSESMSESKISQVLAHPAGAQTLSLPLFCSIVKDDKHKAKDVLFLIEKNWESFDKKILKDQLIKINAEAHRFAITFHKNRRSKSFLE
ncbi:MAG: GIY-YIG nuclease family protein [bacterium]